MLSLCDTVQGMGVGCGCTSTDTRMYGQSTTGLDDAVGTDVVVQFTTGGAPLRVCYHHHAPVITDINNNSNNGYSGYMNNITQTQLTQSLNTHTVPLFNISLIIATLNINPM